MSPTPDTPELEELLKIAIEQYLKMTPEEREAMYLRQSKGWAKAEVQWAKDYREGKCERD